MANLAASELQSDKEDADRHPIAAQAPGADAVAARMFARVRLLMVISGITTLIAIAAVVSVIGYRVFRTGGSAVAPPAEGVIMLPKGARVISSTVADNHIVVTIDIAGATELRTFDVKTLKETGRVRFATEP